MGKKRTLVGLAVIFFGIVAAMGYVLTDPAVVVLHPDGIIADKQRTLIIFTFVLCLVVVIPVYLMLFLFAWRYHADNKKVRYSPHVNHSAFLETIWWGLPCLIILILGTVTWKSSHDLDPSKALASTMPPLTVQVVALQWKWLFIYPAQRIATVNYLQFPVNTPIHFEITSDAPMNSFWIPSLGSQIYAMSGMTTQLNLMADSPGVFNGSSANISGKGFAGMAFKAVAAEPNAFDRWVVQSQRLPTTLDATEYARLAKPSQNERVAIYNHVVSGLYNTVQMKYMSPDGTHANHATTMMDGM